MFTSKGRYGYGEPKNVIVWWVQIPHRPVRARKLPMFRTHRIGPSMKIAEIRVNLSPLYLVCTKAMFISKECYGYGEPKNVICWLVKIPHRPVRARKLPMFRILRRWPSIKIAEIRVNLSPWYLVCTKAIFISKGSYEYGEPKNVICWLVQ